jgi:hypothetical protein
MGIDDKSCGPERGWKSLSASSELAMVTADRDDIDGLARKRRPRQGQRTMYVVDRRDRVVPLSDLPLSSVGAPCPLVFAEEGRLVVGYLLEDTPADWDGSDARMVSSDSEGEPAVIVRFTGPRASMFGPPNNEAFSGHPLAARGLKPHAASEVLQSSWIRALERMNSVHPYHRPESFSTLRHFVIAFHDSTFECVAKGYTWERAQSPLARAVIASSASPEMTA